MSSQCRKTVDLRGERCRTAEAERDRWDGRMPGKRPRAMHRTSSMSLLGGGACGRSEGVGAAAAESLPAEVDARAGRRMAVELAPPCNSMHVDGEVGQWGRTARECESSRRIEPSGNWQSLGDDVSASSLGSFSSGDSSSAERTSGFSSLFSSPIAGIHGGGNVAMDGGPWPWDLHRNHVMHVGGACLLAQGDAVIQKEMQYSQRTQQQMQEERLPEVKIWRGVESRSGQKQAEPWPWMSIGLPPSPWNDEVDGEADGWVPPAHARVHHVGLDFLAVCNFCRVSLDKHDIFMYRGEKAFCSQDCRQKEILREERIATCAAAGRRFPMVPSMASEKPRRGGDWRSLVGTAVAA